MKRQIFTDKLKRVFNLKRFWKDQSAVAMVEFAMLLPVLMLLLLGSFEVGRYALLLQKLDRISATMADLVARSEALSASEVDNLFNSTNHLAAPFDFDTDGMVVITSVVGRAGDVPLVIGQRSKGALAGVSSPIGADGEDATLPDVFTDGEGQTLSQDEGLIIAEVFFNYSLFFTGGLEFDGTTVLSGHLIYRDAYFRPRLSEMTTFD